MTTKKLYTVIIFSENIVGLLNQITIIFTRRQLNIETLSVSPSAIKGIHKFTITTFADEDMIDKVVKQIDKRVDIMMEQGLLDEVNRLKAMGCTRDMVAMQGLGYKEMLDYLDGKISLEEAVYIIKRDTRHFAKRQLTWFKREKEVRFIEIEQFGADQKKILNWICNDYFGGRNEHGTE